MGMALAAHAAAVSLWRAARDWSWTAGAMFTVEQTGDILSMPPDTCLCVGDDSVTDTCVGSCSHKSVGQADSAAVVRDGSKTADHRAHDPGES